MYAVLSKESLEYPVKLMTWIYGLKIKTEAKTKKKRKKRKNANEKDFLLYFRQTYHFLSILNTEFIVVLSCFES